MNTNNLTRRGFILKLGALAGSIVSGFAVQDVAIADNSRPGRLTGAKLSGSADTLTFSLQVDEPVKYAVFTLDSPDRVVIDLKNTTMAGKLKEGAYDRAPLKSIRYAARNDGRLRVVLDMQEQVSVKSAMQSDGSSNVLNVTMKPTGKGASGKASEPEAEQPKPDKADKAKKKSDTSGKARKQKPEGDSERPVNPEPGKGKFIVVIDPGHGGKDPGAIGPGGTREKDVVLQVARKLKSRIDREKGMKAILTRDSDKFIPLRDRMDIAHQYNADLFISVHADASPSSRVSGSSVYILSEVGASSEAARLLAESENSYDVKFGSHSLSNTSSKVASILLDLSQNAMIDRSLNLAKGVLGELSKVNNPLRRQVESARFVVLRSPDIPSMLVETAFISNPSEEKRLRTTDYQQKLASAMFQGVKRYQIAYADDGKVNT
ncbi:N-acetylmuramoyl-L-alanine amidase [Candidatus Thiothrix sp. Deng01]|uniref:N-acetylmuramoyl-L-alanine amidase n=1 Tax=Candidatus Thiothrix phosphatis TaxID=3112415 RepID=A0ABU6CZ07_9GAMM|nr:N-acetylmuramoyl-L-alanine amidase [Candidatus Thiothrix sp. Deng01]MEB4592010.1 N-acetylmuramoyl-L-alanine amidase [Candidatus Thiothrix sp. Deng01]